MTTEFGSISANVSEALRSLLKTKPNINNLNKNDNILIKLYNGEINANIIDLKENKND